MVEMLCPDVAVVGASPAGLAAAYSAARTGAETLLLEAQEEIGVPEPPAKVAFQHLWDACDPPPAATVQQETAEVLVHSPSGHRLTVQAPAWVLDRTAFDQHLVQQAEAAGATVRTGLGALRAQRPTRLHAPQADLLVEPRVTVFADGAGTLAARFLESTRQPGALAWGAWDRLAPDHRPADDRIHITLGQHAPGGRTQLTPVDGGDWAHWTFVQGTREELVDRAPAALVHTLARAGWPRTIHEHASRVAVGPDPVFQVPHRLVGERLVVVGGAAGQGGLEVGLASGALAGEHAGQAVVDGRLDPARLEVYAEAWRSRYQAGYRGLARWNRWLAGLEDRHLDDLLAPWDGRTLAIEALGGLGRSGVVGPVQDLLKLARGQPRALLGTLGAVVPVVAERLAAGAAGLSPRASPRP